MTQKLQPLTEAQARLVTALKKARQLEGWSVYYVPNNLKHFFGNGPATFARNPNGTVYSRMYSREITQFIVDVEAAQ